MASCRDLVRFQFLPSCRNWLENKKVKILCLIQYILIWKWFYILLSETENETQYIIALHVRFPYNRHNTRAILHSVTRRAYKARRRRETKQQRQGGRQWWRQDFPILSPGLSLVCGGPYGAKVDKVIAYMPIIKTNSDAIAHQFHGPILPNGMQAKDCKT